MKETKVRKLTKTVKAAKPYFCACIAAITMINLLQKPLNGGTPEIESAATEHVVPVRGILCMSPPISFSWRVPVRYSMAPEHRNNRDLKTEWFNR